MDRSKAGVLMDEDRCVICQEYINNGEEIVALREKGTASINKASIERNDKITTTVGQSVHQKCRRMYCNSFYIKTSKRKADAISSDAKQPDLRSSRQFSFEEDCLFCGQPVGDSDKKKPRGVYPVRTKEFQETIGRICNERNDDWGVQVLGRIEFARDLHAADALYHQACSVNFRTHKDLPYIFSPKTNKPDNRGRPSKRTQEIFIEVTKYLEEHDDEQITVADAVHKMKELCEDEDDAFGPQYMKLKLRQHYEESLVITDMNGKSNIITFRKTAESILQSFYKRSRETTTETEKLAIIRTAAELIRSDIRGNMFNKSHYPITHDIANVEKNLSYVPPGLQLFLKILFAGKNSNLIIAAVGQSVVQATRPKACLMPLQIGLGVQMHHLYGSRLLVDTLNSLGFCCSYSEVQKYESSSIVDRANEIPNLNSTQCLQFVADNVDHNTRTLDGRNTFHGMGMIACISPGVTSMRKCIPRLDISPEEIAAIAKINIHHYKLNNQDFSLSVKFGELLDLQPSVSNQKIDLLLKAVWPVKSQIPGWSGTMQMIGKTENHNKSSIIYLPMIDMQPSDMSCIFSTIQFLCNESECHNRTPVITFDQPLYFKAFQIICHRQMKNVVLRLGGFHAEMSFLGTIGHIMSHTGLSEALEVAYAPNAVTHMLSGKAISRAVRGYTMIDLALHILLVAETFSINISDVNHSEDHPDVLKKAIDTYDKLIAGKITIDSIDENEGIIEIERTINDLKEKKRESRTAKLWLIFCDMVSLLRLFIQAERSGNWFLHLSTLKNMLPYLAAAGHNHYARCVYVYLSQMQKLEEEHFDVYQHFQAGHHVIHRSDKQWAGISTDLAIEQVLMRSVKSCGGLTRGRGIGEAQRAHWLLSMPSCAELNSAMQDITGAKCQTSEQHVDLSSSRISKDGKDIKSLLEFFEERNPFAPDMSLRNIETGVVAHAKVNVDAAKEIGDKIITSMAEEDVFEFSFKKVNQVITMGVKDNFKSRNNDGITVEPQLMFQRLIAASNCNMDDKSKLFLYELSSFPPSMYDKNGLPREPSKSKFADAIWESEDCSASEPFDPNVVYVLDGGSLLQKLPWSSGESFASLCQMYVIYVKKRYQKVTVVFDGYQEGPSTKDITHTRRTRGITSPPVAFSANMPFKMKKDYFLSNPVNKQRFIDLLSIVLEENGISTTKAPGDADLLIVTTAVSLSKSQKVVVVGEDTDLLVLLCYHAQLNDHSIYFKSDRNMQTKLKKVWDIQRAKAKLGNDVCELMPFIHALTGCDTTARLHGIGKSQGLKKIRHDDILRKQGHIFTSRDSEKEDIIKAGEKAIICLYGGNVSESLGMLRWKKFSTKVVNCSTIVQVETLPPTSDAAALHSMRVFCQCQAWLSDKCDLDPCEWGWCLQDGKLTHKQMTEPPAPDHLLSIIKCNCKTNCETRRCICRKNGLECSSACGGCFGLNCSNSSVTEPDINDQAV